MQMLAAGGMPIVVDDARAPDEDNPHGYFEDARVKRLPVTAAWLGQACGRAVKIVSPLLPHLPPAFAYRVVFTRRNLHEILASQRTMLARRGTLPTAEEDARIMALCERHLEQIETWLAQQPHVQVLAVELADLLARPAVQAAHVAAFLGGGLDVEAMARAVDARLYRHRKSSGTGA